jgi:hypothetical protein
MSHDQTKKNLRVKIDFDWQVFHSSQMHRLCISILTFTLSKSFILEYSHVVLTHSCCFHSSITLHSFTYSHSLSHLIFSIFTTRSKLNHTYITYTNMHTYTKLDAHTFIHLLFCHLFTLPLSLSFSLTHSLSLCSISSAPIASDASIYQRNGNSTPIFSAQTEHNALYSSCNS